MEFYKLYFIIHRRTDWYKLWRWERKIMMPEWYEERRKQEELAAKRLSFAFNFYDNIINQLNERK